MFSLLNKLNFFIQVVQLKTLLFQNIKLSVRSSYAMWKSRSLLSWIKILSLIQENERM